MLKNKFITCWKETDSWHMATTSIIDEYSHLQLRQSEMIIDTDNNPKLYFCLFFA
jgi:hypothetical protein